MAKVAVISSFVPMEMDNDTASSKSIVMPNADSENSPKKGRTDQENSFRDKFLDFVLAHIKTLDFTFRETQLAWHHMFSPGNECELCDRHIYNRDYYRLRIQSFKFRGSWIVIFCKPCSENIVRDCCDYRELDDQDEL